MSAAFYVEITLIDKVIVQPVFCFRRVLSGVIRAEIIVFFITRCRAAPYSVFRRENSFYRICPVAGSGGYTACLRLNSIGKFAKLALRVRGAGMSLGQLYVKLLEC